jgi:hypothetical protein
MMQLYDPPGKPEIEAVGPHVLERSQEAFVVSCRIIAADPNQHAASYHAIAFRGDHYPVPRRGIADGVPDQAQKRSMHEVDVQPHGGHLPPYLDPYVRASRKTGGRDDRFKHACEFDVARRQP